MAKATTLYICQSCGHQSPKWLGKCPSCNQWDTFAEERQAAPAPAGSRRAWLEKHGKEEPVAITEVTSDTEDRVPTGIGELDRVLGGGVVAGSMTLVGGDPGIGKSTLLLQVAGRFARIAPTLYVSGEESPAQIRMRGERLDCMAGNLLILPETNVEEIGRHISHVRPCMVIIDSIQTIYTDELPSAPGTVGQVREAAGRLLTLCKKTGIPIFLIGHVTKEGAIAGPRLLEHMVDTVLYFEGEKGSPFRILRGVKNRFGSTNEIGVFEMKSEGLTEIANPSEIFLSEKPGAVSGSVVVACVNGTRPLLVEIQALVTSTNYPSPRRTTVGVDPNRVAILIAIIEKRAGYHIMGEDVFVNAAGGVRIDEPAIDLGVIVSIVSSFRDAAVDARTVVVGEVGLGGEIRMVPQLESRVMEAAKLGFTRAVIPKSRAAFNIPPGITVEHVETVDQALDVLIER
ncbi:MAG: DNA repair protein RadA [Nitrospinae bacterium]|nr:DNA repair protein RadA [Nitrospinota bacterium]